MGWAIRRQRQVLLPSRPSSPQSSEQLAEPRAAQGPAARDRQTAALRAERHRQQQQEPQASKSAPPWPVSLPHPARRGSPGAGALERADFGWSLKEGESRAREPPKRQEARRADILEVSRMGSHEVSEALVSKRATREAEREEMGHWGEPEGEQRRRGEDPPHSTQARLDPSRDKPAVRGIVPGDVAAAVTARGGAAGQRKKSVRTESRAHLPGLPPGGASSGTPADTWSRLTHGLRGDSPPSVLRLQASPTQLNSRRKKEPNSSSA